MYINDGNGLFVEAPIR